MKTTIITLLIIIGTLLFQRAYSQTTKSSIIYHDYIPDLSLSSAADTIKIDINEDGVLDIEFYFRNTSTGGVFFTKSLTGNCQYTYFYFPTSYNTDSLTSDSLHWISSPVEYIEYFYHGKIGLKFSFAGLSYYGWLLVKDSWVGGLNGKLILTIDKYAFCTIPNYPLLWGQTEIITGTNELKEDTGIKVYATDSGSQLVVQSSDVIKSIRVIDLLGATVVVKDNIRDKQATLSTKGLVHGTYIVKVTNSNLKEYTSKIVF